MPVNQKHQEVVRDYLSGMSYREVAKKHHLHWCRVGVIVRRTGLQRTKSEGQQLRFSRREEE